MAQELLCINDARVVHEVVDGEVIIIDLESGVYYSTSGVGVDLWNLVRNAVSIDHLIDEIANAYGTSRQAVEPSIQAIVDEMCSEQLLTRTFDPSEDAIPGSSMHPQATSAFVPPRLEKHTNMSDLLLLDPIHEVGPQGWPHLRAG